jgi:hypothetical protein
MNIEYGHPNMAYRRKMGIHLADTVSEYHAILAEDDKVRMYSEF